MIGTTQGLTAWATARGLTLPVTGQEAAIASATAKLEAMTGRVLTIPAEDEDFIMDGCDDSVLLLVPELLSVTSVAVDGVEVNADYYRVLPRNSTPKTHLTRRAGVPWLNPDLCTITVTGKRGYQYPVPADLVDLAYLLAANDLAGSAARGLTQMKVGDTVFTLGGAGFEAQVAQASAKHARVSL